MEVQGFPAMYRRCTIGIKARNIEWARLEGRDFGYRGIREHQQVQSHDGVEVGGSERALVVVASGDCLGKRANVCGSSALGLREVEMLGYKLEEPGQCSFSPAICTGRSTRVERDGRKKKLKA